MPLPTVIIKNNPPVIPHNNYDHTLVKPCPGSNNILCFFFGGVSFTFCCDNELKPQNLTPRFHVISSFNNIKQDIR